MRFPALPLTFLFLLLCTLGSAAQPLSVKDQVIDGRLYTKWGTFEAGDRLWYFTTEDDTRMYVGSTAADAMKSAAAKDEDPFSGDLYTILEAQDGDFDDGERREVLLSYADALGQVSSKTWNKGKSLSLSCELADGSGTTASLVSTSGKGNLLVIGSGTTHSPRKFLSFLNSYKPEDTSALLAKVQGARKTTDPKRFNVNGVGGEREQVEPGVHPLGAGTIELREGYLWTQARLDTKLKGVMYAGIAEGEFVIINTAEFPDSIPTPFSPAMLRAYSESYLKSSFGAVSPTLTQVESPYPASLEGDWKVSGTGKLGALMKQVFPKGAVRGHGYFTYADNEAVGVMVINGKKSTVDQFMSTYKPKTGAVMGAVGEDKRSTFKSSVLLFFKASLATLFGLPLLLGILNLVSKGKKVNPWLATILVLILIFVVWVGYLLVTNGSGTVRMLSMGTFWGGLSVTHLVPLLILTLLSKRWVARNP